MIGRLLQRNTNYLHKHLYGLWLFVWLCLNWPPLVYACTYLYIYIKGMVTTWRRFEKNMHEIAYIFFCENFNTWRIWYFFAQALAHDCDYSMAYLPKPLHAHSHFILLSCLHFDYGILRLFSLHPFSLATRNVNTLCLG